MKPREMLVCLSMLAAAALSECHSPVGAKSPPEKILWQGKSDGYTIKWTARDIAVSRGGKLVYSARSEMSKTAHNLAKDLAGFNIDEDVTLLSVVGPYMSIRYHEYDEPLELGEDGILHLYGPHPGGQTFFATIDLRHPGSPIQRRVTYDAGFKPPPLLEQLFGSKSVLQALSQDKVVRASFPKDSLESLAAFKDAIRGESVYLQGQNLCGEFDDYVFNAFCFQNVEGGRVAVRIGVSGAGPCRENLTELGLLLPISPNLKKALADAAAKSQGVLRRDIAKIPPAKFSYKKKPDCHFAR